MKVQRAGVIWSLRVSDDALYRLARILIVALHQPQAQEEMGRAVWAELRDLAGWMSHAAEGKLDP
jgi:hypothetical protein